MKRLRTGSKLFLYIIFSINAQGQFALKNNLMVWDGDFNKIIETLQIDSINWVELENRLNEIYVDKASSEFILYFGNDTTFDFSSIQAKFKGIDYFDMNCFLNPSQCVTPYMDSIANGKWYDIVLQNKTLKIRLEKEIYDFKRNGYFITYYPDGEVMKIQRFDKGLFVDTGFYYYPPNNLYTMFVYGSEPTLIPNQIFWYSESKQLIAIEYYIISNRVKIYFNEQIEIINIEVNEEMFEIHK